MYRIDSADERQSAPKMSAYPRHFRPFTEPISATQDREVPKGTTLPDLIKLFYPGAVPELFSARFGFLDRDNKTREYSPGATDPFVFKSAKSISQFSTAAHVLMAHLCDQWTKLGFPLKKDKDRDIDVPDGEAAIAALDAQHALHKVVVAKRNDIYFILANADIVKKACIVRTINAGWWCVSYAGKNAPNKSHFAMSLSAHKRAIKAIIESDAGKRKYYQFWSENGDPLLTNPGYPYFNGQVDEAGNPITRIKTVALFKGLMTVTQGDWKKLLANVDERAGALGLKGHPFAVAPLRRLQPGYKFAHQFNITGSGLRTAFDERGPNSQRVAHMVPYIYNVITSPMSTLYKVARYFLPGCYHDGDAKRRRTATLQKQAASGDLWLMEADYSNFDRFMPVDLIEEIVGWFTELAPNSKFWYDAMTYLHEDASLIWPDYTLAGSGRGWAFKPGKLGLLSGVKATSETGTLVNSVVNGEALARTYGWNEQQLFEYLTQYLTTPVGSKTEYFYVQSDDTQLISSSPSVLKRHGLAFEEAVKAAGLKGSIEFADRFLMRHIQDGADRPVPARVWQNTLSNESPVEDELIFLAGLTARTDGLFGVKTVDAFGTGKHQPISPVEHSFTTLVLEQLRGFVSTASHPSKTGLQFLDLLLSEGATYKPSSKRTNGTHLAALDSLRGAITRTLAERELKNLQNASRLDANWLYQLHRDKSSPASQMLLDEIAALSPALKDTLASIAGKESKFFAFSCSELGVKPLW